MKKIVLLAFGCLFLASCGPKRMGCGPYRRCEVKLPTTVHPDMSTTRDS